MLDLKKLALPKFTLVIGFFVHIKATHSLIQVTGLYRPQEGC